MKSKSTKTRKIILTISVTLGLAFCFGFINQLPGSENKDLLIIRTFEAIGWNSYLVVLDGENVIEQLELQSPKKNQIDNSKIVSKKLKEYIKKGYKLTNTNCGGEIAQGALITTYILEK